MFSLRNQPPEGWPATSRFLQCPPTLQGRDGDSGHLRRWSLSDNTQVTTIECSRVQSKPSEPYLLRL